MVIIESIISEFTHEPNGPKKGLDEFKIIQHLSITVDNSINDGISEDICLVHHQNIDDAVKFVKKFGQLYLLSKIDIQDFISHYSCA